MITPPVDVDAFVGFEATGWARASGPYHRFFGPVTDRAAEPLLDAALVRRGTTVLDVATGPGYIAARAAARGAVVRGVDLSLSILALARRLHPGLVVDAADAHHLPYATSSFDAVVAGFLLPHLGDPERAVAGMVDIVKPAGHLALSTWDEPGRVAVLGIMMAAVELAGAQAPPTLPPGPPFFQFADEDALHTLLEDAGLVDVHITTHAFTHHVASADALWDGVLQGTVRTAALVAAQAPAMQARIRTAFDRIASGYEDPDGLALPVAVKIASGRRP